jgi:hypothetical protein
MEASIMQFLSPISVLGLLLVVTLGILVFHLAPRRSARPHSSESPPAPMIARKTLWLLAGILTAAVVFVIIIDLYPQLWPSVPYRSQLNSANLPPSIVSAGSEPSVATSPTLPLPPLPGPGAPLQPDSERTVSGVVRAFNYGPGGAIDALILDQGFVAHFPPDQAGRVTLIAQVGARVLLRGRIHLGPAGDRVFDAETVSNEQTGASVSLGFSQGPPPPPGF